jgi:HK97 family phage prohead protease
MAKVIEQRRHAAQLEMRADADTVALRGYATVYDEWYDVAGGPERGGWREIVRSGAGKRTLNASPDVRLLVNHDGVPLARTRSGTLTLTEDERGLIVDAPSLDMRNPSVQELRSAMSRRDLDEMSFTFRVTRNEWNDDYTERTIAEYDLSVAGADVSVVTYPANPATVAAIRDAVKIDELRAACTTTGAGMSLAFAHALREQLRRRA